MLSRDPKVQYELVVTEMYNLIPQMVQENKKLKRQSQLLLSQVGGQVNLVSGLLTEIIDI